MRFVSGIVSSVVVAAVAFGSAARSSTVGGAWSRAEREQLRSLSIAALPPLPPDPSNRVADDARAAALGHRLFFDTRLSGNGQVSCASCHDPAKAFQDGIPLGKGVGTAGRRTMPIAGTAHSPWQFWDGRADSQWAQALGPLESAVEHGGTRSGVAHEIARRYRAEYEAVFGALPSLDRVPAQGGPVADAEARAAWVRLPAARQTEINRVYANVGKAIAAYERTLAFAPARFDRYADAVLAGRTPASDAALTADEEAGLRLFIGRASCVNCHNGPRFTDDHFHNTGVPVSRIASGADSGRATGARGAVQGEFSCTSRYSDATDGDCDELRFTATDGEELVRAYKTPSLRGVTERAPYMHAGQIASITEVLRHYRAAPRAPLGHSELKPLRLSDRELQQLEAFLRTLSSPVAGPAHFLRAPQ